QREMERALALHQTTIDRLTAEHQKEVERLSAERDRADQEARMANTQRQEAEIRAARFEEKLAAAIQALEGLQRLQQEIQRQSETLGEYRAGNWELQRQLQAQQQYIESLHQQIEALNQRKRGWFGG
ncbi:MAG: hypothetical protein L0312_24310, partial [Acidobacteria bacterium]|nr:hypothetical protein [Acidobacteriota bacterium]